MILSTQCDALAERLGYKEAIRVLAKAGYDAIDLSLFKVGIDNGFPFGENDENFVNELKALAAENGVFFNQAHAPFPSNEGNFTNICRAIELAGKVGARQIIVHPTCGFKNAEALREYNIGFYNSLIPYIKKAGVKVALENMWGYDSKRGHIIPNYISFAHELAALYDALDPEYFTVCLDIGHCALIGEEPADAVRVLASRIGALHVHDVDYRDDLHTLPSCGKLDWNGICAALADIDYKGEFTFEADNFLKPLDDDFLLDGASYMCKMGRHLIAKIENAK